MSIPNAHQFSVSRFKIYRRDYKRNEGGLMMYIRNDMPQYQRNDLEACSLDSSSGRIEVLAVEVLIRKKRWIFISLYKQPKVKTCQLIICIDNMMTQLSTQDFNVILFGDFNVNMMKHNELTDCLQLNGLTNLVKEPTCFKGTPSVIDLIVTNAPKSLKNTACFDTGLSDFHSLVCTASKIHVPKMEPCTFKYRGYKKFSNEKFVHELSLIPFQVIEIFDDLDDSYWLWNELTMQVINEHAPIKSRTIKSHRVPYMNGELRWAINIKNMLRRKYDKINNNKTWNRYRSQRNLVTKLRKKSINVYLQNKCSSTINSQNNGKQFWNTVSL